MNLPWFRMYTEAVDDPKLRLLAFEDRWHFIAILCCKGQGIIDTNPELLDRMLAVKLGVQGRELDEIKRRLMEVGLVDDCWQPTAWGKRQFVSDQDPTNAERQKRYRNALRNVTVTPTDTDTDTEQNRTETTSDASASRDYPPEFDDAWAIYPPREGDNPKKKAYQCWRARLKGGHTADDIRQGVERYREYCQAKGQLNTEFVMQAKRFFGPDEPFLKPWTVQLGKPPRNGRKTFADYHNGGTNGRSRAIDSTAEPVD